ncbi:hypothetical protein BJX64DRAFT_245937 [Aspergillus heterothallicus]
MNSIFRCKILVQLHPGLLFRWLTISHSAVCNNVQVVSLGYQRTNQRQNVGRGLGEILHYIPGLDIFFSSPPRTMIWPRLGVDSFGVAVSGCKIVTIDSDDTRQYEIRRMLICQCHSRQRSQYQHQTLSPKVSKSNNRTFRKRSRSDTGMIASVLNT